MQSPRPRLFSILVALLFLLSLLAQCTRPIPIEYTAPISPLSTPIARVPANINQMLSHAAVVVIGEVGPVDKYIDFHVYGDDGRLMVNRPLSPWGGGEMGDSPATDFVLNVEEVLRDDGTIAAGKPIILRSGGYLTEEGTQDLRSIDTSNFTYTLPWTGDRGLFLLNPTPDGEAYSFYYDGYGWLHVDGEQLFLSDGPQSPLVLDGEDVSLSALRWSLEHPDAAFVGDFSRFTTLADILVTYAYRDVGVPLFPPVVEGTPTWTPTPAPTSDPVGYRAGMYGLSRNAAQAQLDWLADGGEEIIAEVEALTDRLNREEPTYLVSWYQTGPDFRYVVRLDQVDPDEASFHEKYLQEYAWAENVTLLGRDQPDPLHPYTPSPDPTPTPVIDPVDFYQERYGFTREGAIAKARWAAISSERWRGEAGDLFIRLRDTHPTYLVSWLDDQYFFTYYIRLDEEEPAAAAFAEEYLQGYEWADRVVLLGRNE